MLGNLSLDCMIDLMSLLISMAAAFSNIVFFLHTFQFADKNHEEL